MIKKILFVAIVLSGSILLPSCKPTEKNYKAAYDAALAKRQAEEHDADLNLPAAGFTRIGDPEKKEINGKQYDYLFLRLSPLNADAEIKPYNVAVAVYKMPTNCEAQVKDLQAAGYKAFGAKATDDRYYVVVASLSSLEEAADEVDKYMSKNKEAVYVGLKGTPTILQCR
ncbi:MAG: hypothetical protein HDR88_16015 [Bacteroides sp.]|nr:hypothetical protein [Bacteroides sp.]